MCINVIHHVCMCTCMSSAAEAKEGLGSLGLELQAVVNLCVGAENWTRSREGAASVPNLWLVSQAPALAFLTPLLCSTPFTVGHQGLPDAYIQDTPL